VLLILGDEDVSTPNYMTPEGARKLSEEMARLRAERPKVVQEVADAAAQGDRSENAEYIYGKKRLREIDRRVRYLQKRLADVIVVDRTPDDPTRVFFGAWVHLEDDDGNRATYRIVGADEFDLQRGFISIDSPLARALLKKAEGEEVSAQLPKGTVTFTLVAVRYAPFDDVTP
jgi:transcription elongation factor GreB